LHISMTFSFETNLLTAFCLTNHLETSVCTLNYDYCWALIKFLKLCNRFLIKHLFFSWIGTFNVFNTSIIPQTIYGFNTMPIRVHFKNQHLQWASYFAGPFLLKCIMGNHTLINSCYLC
jgi:hypothetical protein